MNLTQLKRNVGMAVKLQPAACHLDAYGEALPYRDEDWTIVEVTDDSVAVSASELRYRLGRDNVHHFNTDADRSEPNGKRGILILNVQLFVEGVAVRAVANTRPGTPMFPSVDRARRARAYLAPHICRALARQVGVINRVLPSYSMTSHGKASCPGDTWLSLVPYPTAPIEGSGPFADLSTSDLVRIGEFFASLHEIANLLDLWTATGVSRDEYNAWNFLMHKVEHSLRVGAVAVAEISADAPLDETVPSGGTVIQNVAKGLADADRLRKAFIARRTSLASVPARLVPQAVKRQPPRGAPPRGATSAAQGGYGDAAEGRWSIFR